MRKCSGSEATTMPGRKRFRTDHPDEIVRGLERARQRARLSMRRMAEALDVPFRTYQKWVYSSQKPRHSEELLARANELMAPHRLNCWEFLDCGRGPGEPKNHVDGVCPATVDRTGDGVNSGTCGGRVCWAISGTFCGSRPQGTEASKILSCFSCPFFTRVLQEEGLANFKLLRPGQVYTQT
jgi:hypothetical protein